MKKAALIFAILLFSNYNIFSQVISRPMQGLTPDELNKSYIIPQLTTDPYQKVMACATAANDNFANAIALTVNGGTVSGSTCGTFQAGEAYGCNTAGDPTVWYKFVATATTLYVQIDGLTGSCYFGSAIYQTNIMPTANCGNNGPISCQSASGGPNTQLYQLTNLTVGATYYVQISYPSGGLCGTSATFAIQVTTANPGGTITNPPPLTTCSSPGAGCFFNSPPSVNTVTSTCTSYPLTAAGYNANSVWETVVQFTSSASWSNFSWQAIITSNCFPAGNVVWFNWTLYDCNCNQITCGDINALTGNGLACGTCYRLRYQMELANCSSFTTIWPYQNVPASPTPCTVLPIDLLYFTANSNPFTKKVNLEWESLTENNLKEYKMFRSDDGINFNLLTSVPPKPNSVGTESKKYNYEDACCTTQETRYYKLKAIDSDGATSFEKTIAVTIKGNKELIKFAPNPAKDNFVITFGDGAKNVDTHVLIMNSVGQVIKKENFISDNFKQIDLKELPTGIYFINVITGSSQDILNYKLIKE